MYTFKRVLNKNYIEQKKTGYRDQESNPHSEKYKDEFLHNGPVSIRMSYIDHAHMHGTCNIKYLFRACTSRSLSVFLNYIFQFFCMKASEDHFLRI